VDLEGDGEETGKYDGEYQGLHTMVAKGLLDQLELGAEASEVCDLDKEFHDKVVEHCGQRENSYPVDHPALPKQLR